MTPCPICLHNGNVRFNKFTCEVNNIKKCLNKELTQDVIIGVQCICTDEHHDIHTNKKSGKKTWISHTPANIKRQPDSLRRRHLEFFAEMDENHQSTLVPGVQ